MALTLSSAARLANPNFGNIEQLGQDIGSLSARRRQRGMLTDLLSPLTDPMATSADYATAAEGLMGIDQGLGLQVAARGRTLAEEEKARRDQEKEIRRERGLQVSLQAITQGAMRGVPLSSDEKPDLRSVVKSVFDNQGTNQQIADAYEAGLKDPKKDLLVVGGKLYNTKTKKFIDDEDAAEMLPLSDLKDLATAESVIQYAQTGDDTKLVAIDPEDERKSKPFMDTKSGSELYQAAVAEKSKVEGDISRFEGIIAQSERFAGESEDFTGTPLIGGVLGDLTDFVVSDIAGLGNEITAFRTSLNEIQMQKALALLPRGPASDRDVQLALRASPDLKDYNEEERLAALRGMKKIMEARRDYLEGKVKWMQVTNDANAIGYELHAEIKGYDKNIESLQETYSEAIKEIDGLVQAAIQARKNGNQQEYERLIVLARAADADVKVIDAFGNPVKGLGYVKSIEDRGKASVLLDTSLKRRDIAFEDVRGI